MILDLDFMHYGKAINVIHWCILNNVDRVKAEILAEALYQTPMPNIKWELEVPDKYVPWLILNFELEIINSECIGD